MILATGRMETPLNQSVEYLQFSITQHKFSGLNGDRDSLVVFLHKLVAKLAMLIFFTRTLQHGVNELLRTFLNLNIAKDHYMFCTYQRKRQIYSKYQNSIQNT